MKKLVFAALMLGGLAQATGCIITSDDDDDDVNTAQFDVTWNLTEGDSETAAACADYGIETIQVVSEPTSGSQYIDLYTCSTGFDATAPLPLGDYTVWVNALDAGDNMIAQSNSQAATLDLGNELVPLTFTFPVDGGFFALTWTLVDDATNDPVTCTEVGAAGGVDVLATIVDTTTAFDDIFDCEDGEGVTAKVDVADYTVVVNVLNANEEALGTSNPRTVSIDYGNELEDLGNFEFAFQ